MCLGHTTAHAQMPGQSVRVGILVKQCQGSGRGLPSVKLERVTVEVMKVPRLTQVI